MLSQYLTTANLLAIAYLVILEGVLSVDNALALAALVRGRLPDPVAQKHALRWGILGAYILRTVVIFAGVWLMEHWQVKACAAAYLIWLSINELFLKKGLDEGESEAGGLKLKWLSPLWSTIIAVECMDAMFSIDSIAVTLSVSDKVFVLIAGAVMGIMAMRFAAQLFIKLIERFPILEKTAFVLVLMAGVKIILELAHVEIPEEAFIGAMFLIIGGSMLIGGKRGHAQGSN